MDETYVDLTQPLSAGMTRYPLLPEVTIDDVGSTLQATVLHVGSHAGTHIDAPVHIVPGGARIQDLPLDRFTGGAVVSRVDAGPGEAITLEQVLDGGPEPERGETLLIHTGFSDHFEDFDKYHDHSWLDVEVAVWAVERELNMVGVDMFSPDQPIERRDDTFDYPIHRTLLFNDVLIVENLTNLANVPEQRGEIFAFPLVVLSPGGDAGHVRFVWK